LSSFLSRNDDLRDTDPTAKGVANASASHDSRSYWTFNLRGLDQPGSDRVPAHGHGTGTTSGSGVCISASGEWIFGGTANAGGIAGPTFVWNVPTSQVTALPSVSGAQYVFPAHINETLSLVVANTNLGVHLFDGSSFINVSGITPIGNPAGPTFARCTRSP
jgi:hypothetical protein